MHYWRQSTVSDFSKKSKFLSRLNFSYETDADLFGYDYKGDLNTKAVERDRVFKLRQLEETDDEEEFDDNPFGNLGMSDTGLEMTGVNSFGKMVTQTSKKPAAVNKTRLETVEQEDESEMESEMDFPAAPNEFGFGAFKPKTLR